MSYLRIREVQKAALESITELPKQTFKSLAERLCNSENPSIRASELLKTISAATENEEIAKALCSQLISLSSFRRSERLTSPELVDMLFRGMPEAGFSNESRQWFEEMRDDFTNLLDSESVKLPAKALQLGIDYERLWSSANIVTEVRPVFDGERSSISGAIVAQIIKIHYVTSSADFEPSSISVALDLEDIKNLEIELKKAKRKAEAAREELANSFGNDVFTLGEEKYGFS